MAGPPYPPPPAPGSNAIGTFQIGVSSIGTIPQFDFWDTFQSEYANSPHLSHVIARFVAAIDPTQNIDDFYDYMWNIYTAKGYGLDCWGRILGVSRVLHIPGNIQYLGFEEADDPAHEQPFNVAPFYSGGLLTENYSLPDPVYLLLLLAKALANICDGSIPALNQILLTLFPNRGNCFVTDGQDMTMTYTFDFALSPVEESIITQSGVLPTPSGVAASVVII